MKVQLLIDVPSPEQTANHPEPLSVEDKVKHALELIESGYKSDVEWNMIHRLYKSLKALKKPSERAQNLLKMIEPVLNHNGYYGVPKK